MTDEDYATIEAAVTETARGRRFLAEHARRNRHLETERVLLALGRISSLLERICEPKPLNVSGAFMPMLRVRHPGLAGVPDRAASTTQPSRIHGAATLDPVTLREIEATLLSNEKDQFQFPPRRDPPPAAREAMGSAAAQTPSLKSAPAVDNTRRVSSVG